MRTLSLIIILFLCSSPAYAGQANIEAVPKITLYPHPSSTTVMQQTKVVQRVIDGDTIMVKFYDRVRLLGVDTPETVHPNKPVEYYGKEASEFLSNLLPVGTKVTLQFDRANIKSRHKDRYKRLLAYIFLEDGTFVNAEILKQGYGFAYTKYPFEYMDEFREYEREARASGVGLWANPDKQFDGEIKYKQHGFIGSRNSNRYHSPGCRYASRIHRDNLIKFTDKNGAVGYGYVACRVCKP